GLSHDFAQPTPPLTRTDAGKPCSTRFTGCPYSGGMKNGDNVRYAGLVICRQRPGTAGGVVFMTLEDETGFVNAVIWESVFQRYSVLAKTVSFLGITGKLQVEDSGVHLIGEKLWQPRMKTQTD